MKSGRVALLAGLFLAGLSLRPQLVGVGPLLPRIQGDLGVSHAIAGLLGTIPVLCMGIFAPTAAYLSRRIGWRYAIAVSVAAIALFGIARALAPGTAAVILLTIPLGVGIAVAGTVLPVVVKERFADRPAFATGVYASGINFGTAASALLAVPVARAAGGWRESLLAFACFSSLLVGAFFVLSRGERAMLQERPRPPRLPWRSPLAWRLVLVFANTGIVFYGVNAWLPDSFVERGWSEGSAGALLAVANLCGLPAGFVLSWLSDHLGTRRLYLLGITGVEALALALLVLQPGGAWAWAVLLGLALGSLFPAVLMLPLDAAAQPADVGALAGLMLGAGYAISGLSPFVLGAIRDATGSFSTSLWLLVGFALLTSLTSLSLSRERLQSGAATPSRAR